MTTGIGLLLVLIGLIAGLGIVLWLFTHDRSVQLTGYIDTAKREDLVDYKEITPLKSAFKAGYAEGFEAGGGDNSVLPPDDIIERHMMHRKGY